ncbi:MAG: hypothetical protein AB7O49_20485 [Sphingomonadales bacterium]
MTVGIIHLMGDDMTRTLVGAISLIVVLSSASVFGRTDAPMFEFKEVKAGEAVDTSVAGDCKNHGLTLDCVHPDGTVAGAPVGDIAFRFYEERLISMDFVFQNSGFYDIRTAFLRKYGQPCSEKNKEWRNQMGAVLDNVLLTWCFRTGKLQLQARGERSNVGNVSYKDIFQPPSQPVPIDF